MNNQINLQLILQNNKIKINLLLLLQNYIIKTEEITNDEFFFQKYGIRFLS